MNQTVTQMKFIRLDPKSYYKLKKEGPTNQHSTLRVTKSKPNN